LQKDARDSIYFGTALVSFFFLAKLKKVEIIYFIVGNIDDHFTLRWKDVLLSIVNSKYKKPGTFLLIVLF